MHHNQIFDDGAWNGATMKEAAPGGRVTDAVGAPMSVCPASETAHKPQVQDNKRIDIR